MNVIDFSLRIIPTKDIAVKRKMGARRYVLPSESQGIGGYSVKAVCGFTLTSSEHLADVLGQDRDQTAVQNVGKAAFDVGIEAH
jgi:hypothetical protein